MKPTRALDSPTTQGARLAGFAAARPSHTIPGHALVERFGKDAAWLQTRSGIEQLHRLGPAECLIDLAEAAARDALKDAGQSRADLVLVATCSQPNGFGDELGRHLNTPAMTLNAACSGFVFGLTAAADHVRTGQAETVLVVGAEQMSRLVDPADLGTSILFADGAGAAVVTAAGTGADGFEPAEFFSDGSTARDVLQMDRTTLRMDGSAVFRWAVETVPELIKRALYRASITPGEIDVFVPHQANLRIIERVRRAAGLDHALTAEDIRTAGNTSAASIPMALTALREQHDVKGKLALLVGFGAGLSAAAQIVRLP